MVIFVFAMGIIMLSTLMSSIQYAQRSGAYLEAASQAARVQLETIRNSQFSSITNGASFTSSLPSTLPAGSTGTVAVSVPANAPLSKQVDVTVSYPIGSLTKQVTLSAYIDPPETP